MYGHKRWLNARIETYYDENDNIWSWKVFDTRDDTLSLSSGGCKSKNDALLTAAKSISNQIKRLSKKHYVMIKSALSVEYHCPCCGTTLSHNYHPGTIFSLDSTGDDYVDLTYVGYIDNNELIETTGYQYSYTLSHNEYNVNNIYEDYILDMEKPS
jgi:hypothetical protein